MLKLKENYKILSATVTSAHSGLDKNPIQINSEIGGIQIEGDGGILIDIHGDGIDLSVAPRLGQKITWAELQEMAQELRKRKREAKEKLKND